MTECHYCVKPSTHRDAWGERCCDGHADVCNTEGCDGRAVTFDDHGDLACEQHQGSVFRSGDVVRHKPSGETWVLAVVEPENGRAWPAGWPCSSTPLVALEMVEAASGEASLKMLREVAAMENDPRRAIAERQLAATEGKPASDPAPPLSRVDQALAVVDRDGETEVAQVLAEEVRRLHCALREFTVDKRGSALSLRREVENGVAIRQSAESKLARADVLESCAGQIERLLHAD